MLVSIVIGALNEEKYIGKTLKTAKNQNTKHKIELIVGDGYSEDKTVAIAKKLGAKVVLEKNRSAAWERQAASKIAKGELICFTDADADIPNNWIELVASEFEKDNKLVLFYGPGYLSDITGFNKFLSGIMMDAYLGVLSFFGYHNPSGFNMAVRRSAFEKIGGFNTKLVTAEDIDLAKRISKQGKIKYNPAVKMYVSARRVKKWGYIKFTLFHIINGIKYQFFGKSSDKYEAVR